MNEFFSESLLFGFTLSVAAYAVGVAIQQKFKKAFLSPLIIAMFLIILILKVFKIDYETYDYGAKYITYFIQPATVCLAIPLYKQFEVLKKNPATVVVSVLAGCIAHLLIMLGSFYWLQLDETIIRSLISKSVTLAFALPITGELGGIGAITIIGLTIAGILGAVVGPSLLKALKITDPVAQGLGIGASSHGVGCGRLVELGEVYAAMGTVAVSVAGILTVVLVNIAVMWL